MHYKKILAALLLGLPCLSGCLLKNSVSTWGGAIAPPTYLAKQPLLPNPELSVLWAGHATVLIQIHDKVFLTDPVFDKTVGMLSQRLMGAGLDPQTLNQLDYTLISHLHFDHFDFSSLDRLPHGGELILPLGALGYTPSFGFREIRELNPREVFEKDGVRITAVPVIHVGGRYGIDPWLQDTAFSGYLIEYRGVTVFFSGDTAYDPLLFKLLGSRHQIDLALLPIAPIEPRHFMRDFHTDPQEALQLFADLKASYMVPIHHSTFVQGYDKTPQTPVLELNKLLIAQGKQREVLLLKVGEQRMFKGVGNAG